MHRAEVALFTFTTLFDASVNILYAQLNILCHLSLFVTLVPINNDGSYYGFINFLLLLLSLNTPTNMLVFLLWTLISPKGLPPQLLLVI